MVGYSQLADLVEEIWTFDLVDSLYCAKKYRHPEEFRDASHDLLGRSGKLILTGSGREALTAVLRCLRAKAWSRNRVFASSFNCRIVKAAIADAGLIPETFDLASPTGRVDWNAVGEMLSSDYLAIVVPHFFGVPTDFRPLVHHASKHGVRIIEDCAHTLGGSIAGAIPGTIGDAALFSFNYDKPISLAGGGMLLVNDRSIELDQQSFSPSPPPNIEYRQIRAVSAFLRFIRSQKKPPKLITKIANRIGIAPYAVPGLPTGIGMLRASLGMWQLERWEAVAAQRNRNGRAIADIAGIAAWHVDEGVIPTYLKQRILVGQERISKTATKCRQLGIIVANSNWSKTMDWPVIETRPNATAAAKNGLDVPVHQNLSPSQVHRLAECLQTNADLMPLSG